MMGPQTILRELRDRGVFCRIEGDRFICKPSEKLTEPLREAIRAHKTQLLKLVARWQALADSKACADLAEGWQEECFLCVCSILRGATGEGALLARWNGLRPWLAAELPPEGVAALGRLVESLRVEEATEREPL